MYVSVKVNSNGHGLGVYRSRGDHLYFFDANCGVYRIPSATSTVAGFFTALEGCYAAANAPLTYVDVAFVHT